MRLNLHFGLLYNKLKGSIGNSAERQYICSLFKTDTNYNRRYIIGRWQCILASKTVANSNANQD